MFLFPFPSEFHLCQMKITVEEEGYVFSREWEVDEIGQGHPSIDDAVEAALYLLCLVYEEEKVEESARYWEV